MSVNKFIIIKDGPVVGKPILLNAIQQPFTCSMRQITGSLSGTTRKLRKDRHPGAIQFLIPS